MTMRMLPNPANLLVYANGRLYAGVIDTVYENIPVQDGEILSANGWMALEPATSEADPLALLKTNNLSDLANAAIARANLGVSQTAGVSYAQFVDPTEVTVTWSDATRTVTITPVGASYRFYVAGVLFTKTVAESFTISNVTGNHYVYYDASGTLAERMTWSDLLITSYSFVQSGYWNATTGKAVPDMMQEIHHASDPTSVHLYLHNTQSTKYDIEIGGLLPSVTTDGDGSNINQVQVACSAGAIWDDDAQHLIPARLASDNVTFLYRTGAGAGTWTYDETSSAIVRTAGTGRAAYNQFTGGAWQETECTDGYYTLSFLYAIPGLTKHWMVIQGTAEYASLNLAMAAAPAEIAAITGIPLGEHKDVAALIIETQSAYANAVKSRIRKLQPGVDFIDFRLTETGSTSMLIGSSLLSINDATINGITVGLGGGSITSNTVLGFSTLPINTTGYGNVVVGSQAGHLNTSGYSNTYIGWSAGYSGTTAFTNNFIGSGSGFNNVSGSANNFMGNNSGYFTTTGYNNAFFGFQAGYRNTTGGNNNFFGTGAGNDNTTGSNVIAIGIQSGWGTGVNANTTGSDNIFIGGFSVGAGAADTNEIVIGSSAVGLGSNTTVIGNSSTTTLKLFGSLIDVNVDKTITAAGTTGAQTINKPTGTVNFAAAASSLVVTNSLVTANSIILCTVGTDDATMKSVQAVAAAGSFTLYPSANPTAETRVNFLVIN